MGSAEGCHRPEKKGKIYTFHALIAVKRMSFGKKILNRM